MKFESDENTYSKIWVKLDHILFYFIYLFMLLNIFHCINSRGVHGPGGPPKIWESLGKNIGSKYEFGQKNEARLKNEPSLGHHFFDPSPAPKWMSE